jgi:hypothetical protein
MERGDIVRPAIDIERVKRAEAYNEGLLVYLYDDSLMKIRSGLSYYERLQRFNRNHSKFATGFAPADMLACLLIELGFKLLTLLVTPFSCAGKDPGGFFRQLTLPRAYLVRMNPIRTGYPRSCTLPSPGWLPEPRAP